MSPRALVIAYDFPPHGAIGTMRTLRLVRQLQADGWETTVLTSDPRSYLPGTAVDPSLEERIPEGVRVLRVRARRPYHRLEELVRRARRAGAGSSPRLATGRAATAERPERGRIGRALVAARDLLEAALDIPDKEAGWILPAVWRGIRHFVTDGRPDVIYSSAPPWSGQVVALALAAAGRTPWVADFRDPWARAPWRDWRRPFRQRVAAGLERAVIARASAILLVTHANRQEYIDHYGLSIAERLHFIPNGCDPTEFDGSGRRPQREEFVLLHAGTFYGPRSPMPVIHAIARAVRRGALDARTFRLRLLGQISLSVDLPAECRRLGVPDILECLPRVSRAQSLTEMTAASALLLVQTGTTMSVPGKAYEYLAAGRPVLALSEEGETSALIRSAGVGVSVAPNAPVEEIEEALLQVVAHARGTFVPAPPHMYDGRVQASATSDLLRACVRRLPPTAPAVPDRAIDKEYSA